MNIIKKVLLLLLFLVVVGVFLEIIPTAPQYKGTNPWIVGAGNRPLIIPHGGAKALYPENTIYAYQEIAKAGYDVLEVDLSLTKDNKLISMHDQSIKRFTNVDLIVRDHMYADLLNYNYAMNFKAEDGSYPYKDLQTTDELYDLMRPALLSDLFSEYSNHKFILEIKDTVENSGEETFKQAVEELIEVIKTHHMEDKVLVSSFDDQVIDYFKDQSKGSIMTSTAQDEVLDFVMLNLLRLNFFYSPTDGALVLPITQKMSDGQVDMIKKLPPFLRNQAAIYDEDSGNYYSNIVNDRMVRDAHRHNMAVIYWTVNDEEDMKRLIKLGVDGIITDRPDQLKLVLEELGYTFE